MNDETRLHLNVVRWWNMSSNGLGVDRRLLAHAANGGRRNPREGAILKGMAVRPGFPDLMLLAPRGVHFGLFMELKSPTGRTSPDQVAMIALLRSQGYAATVCKSLEQAINTITTYITKGTI